MDNQQQQVNFDASIRRRSNANNSMNNQAAQSKREENSLDSLERLDSIVTTQSRQQIADNSDNADDAELKQQMDGPSMEIDNNYHHRREMDIATGDREQQNAANRATMKRQSYGGGGDPNLINSVIVEENRQLTHDDDTMQMTSPNNNASFLSDNTQQQQQQQQQTHFINQDHMVNVKPRKLSPSRAPQVAINALNRTLSGYRRHPQQLNIHNLPPISVPNTPTNYPSNYNHTNQQTVHNQYMPASPTQKGPVIVGTPSFRERYGITSFLFIQNAQ